jgi:DNA repair exonuclease SbcCD ATPase subunit
MNRPLGPSGYEPLQVSEEPTGEYYTIDYWEKRATHFEAEFDAANKEVLYLQEKQSALKKWVIEQRNLAHVNCLEETKQAYNNVIAYLESATSQVSVEDKEPLPQQEGDGWKQLTYRALYNSLQREKTLQSQLSEALQGLEKWSNKFAEQRAKYLESLQTIKSQEAEIEKLQEVWKVKDETIETLVSRISELELEIAEGTGLVEFLDMENQRLKAELRKHLK